MNIDGRGLAVSVTAIAAAFVAVFSPQPEAILAMGAPVGVAFICYVLGNL